MKSTSQAGGRCEEQGTGTGAGTGLGEGSGKSGVSPWAAGMYEKIKAFEIDRAGDAFPFSARLARENGWSRGYTLKVIEEYRRFVCLMATAAHPVTPSEAVDQAWHLHMTYTRSYWDGLCKGLVGRPLHHDPTRGGSEESAKFTDWYARTLETYRRAFRHEPPADVWPAPATRSEPMRMQWVDLAKFKLVRRERWTRRGGWKWLGLVPAVAVSAGCAGAGGGPAAAIGLVVFVAVLIGLVVLAVAVRASSKKPSHSGRRRRRHGGSSGCGSSGFIPFWGSDTSNDSHGHGHGHGHGHDGGHHGTSSSPSDGGHGSSDGGGHGCSGGGDGGGGSGCGGGGDGGGGGCGGGGCGGGGD